ncbi:hypothetical protein niasHS_016578 [Heterodera schachtii]|uniref:Uncharacterized protein n=1 Tax=Heterodera schachtii TaxID=97005 RepID=A0ABD2HUG3_HETSC
MNAVLSFLISALTFFATDKQEAAPGLMEVRRREAYHQAGLIMANHLDKHGTECRTSTQGENEGETWIYSRNRYTLAQATAFFHYYFGGSAAEKMTFGVYDVNASFDDWLKAGTIAHAIVCQYENNKEKVVERIALTNTKFYPYNDNIKQRIKIKMEKAFKFVSNQFKKEEVKEAINQLANALLQKTELHCDEIKRLEIFSM